MPAVSSQSNPARVPSLGLDLIPQLARLVARCIAIERSGVSATPSDPTGPAWSRGMLATATELTGALSTA